MRLHQGEVKVHIVPRPSGRFAGQKALALTLPACRLVHLSHLSMTDDALSFLATGTVLNNSIDEQEGYLQNCWNAPESRSILYKVDVQLAQGLATIAPYSCPGLEAHVIEYPNAERLTDPENVFLTAWGTSKEDSRMIPRGYLRLHLAEATGNSEGQLQQWLAREGSVVEEGVLAQGHLLGIVHNSTGARKLCIFDAELLDRGPVCVVQLPFSLPWGLHACFAQDVLLDEPPR
jgi:hypothetical protein